MLGQTGFENSSRQDSSSSRGKHKIRNVYLDFEPQRAQWCGPLLDAFLDIYHGYLMYKRYEQVFVRQYSCPALRLPTISAQSEKGSRIERSPTQSAIRSAHKLISCNQTSCMIR
jgi:hypothetical protein